MSEEQEQVKSGFFAGIDEDKLLGLWLAGLAVVLVVGLLIWRSIDSSDVAETLPQSAKQSVWFDKNGLVRSEPTSPNVDPAISNSSAHTAATDVVLVDEGAEEQAGKAAGNAGTPVRTASKSKRLPKQEKPDFIVQLASFSQYENAEALSKRVEGAAPLVEVSTQDRASGKLNVVRVPVFGARAEADRIAATLKSQFGLAPLIINNQ